MRLASSSRSSGSRCHPGRYRMLAPASQVEESLFDSRKPLNEQNSQGVKVPQMDQEQKTLQIISKDLIRTMRVPRRDRSRESIVIPSCGFKWIVSESQTGGKTGREALKQAYLKEKAEKLKAAEAIKKKILAIEETRKQKPELTDIQLDAQNKAKHIVDRAYDLKMEREEEIKKLNQFILGAQCQSTWDDQLKEKREIQAQLDEEGKRLDTMMEVERRRIIAGLEKFEDLRKQQRMKGQEQISIQIKEHMEEKLNQDLLKELHKEQVIKDHERMIQEDLEAEEKKRKDLLLLHEEIKRINDDVTRAREKRLKDEKMADQRAEEFMKKKLEREAEHEAEQQRIKKEKEMEITRLRAQQEKAKDHKAEQDEIRARRNQEISDKKWRLKQRELAAKKAHEEAVLKAARLEQVKSQEHCLMMEANREKAELERVLKSQQEAMAKEKELREKKLQKALQHAEALRQQVKERELSALAQRRERFKEADRMIEENRLRSLRLIEVKEKKLKELKATGIAEKYCSDVERRARKTIVDPNPVKV